MTVLPPAKNAVTSATVTVPAFQRPGSKPGASEPYVRLHFRARPDDLTEAVTRLTTAWHAYNPLADRVHPRPAIAI